MQCAARSPERRLSKNCLLISTLAVEFESFLVVSPRLFKDVVRFKSTRKAAAVGGPNTIPDRSRRLDRSWVILGTPGGAECGVRSSLRLGPYFASTPIRVCANAGVNWAPLTQLSSRCRTLRNDASSK